MSDSENPTRSAAEDRDETLDELMLRHEGSKAPSSILRIAWAMGKTVQEVVDDLTPLVADHHGEQIPGPDPGACPECGEWLKAGMLHDCPGPTAATVDYERRTMDDDQIKANLAAVRERMVAALGADEEAVKVLNSVFPDDWSDAPHAAIWMLGNAARFADPDTNGICTPAFAQGWLDRLVDSEGNPRDEFGRSVIEHVMDENELSARGSLTKVFDRADRLVLELSVLKMIPERAASRDEVREKFVEHLTGYADTLVDALYEPEEAPASA